MSTQLINDIKSEYPLNVSTQLITFCFNRQKENFVHFGDRDIVLKSLNESQNSFDCTGNVEQSGINYEAPTYPSWRMYIGFLEKQCMSPTRKEMAHPNL